jgi:hypothetical protein
MPFRWPDWMLDCQKPETLWSSHNREGTNRITVLAEYMEVIGIRG